MSRYSRRFRRLPFLACALAIASTACEVVPSDKKEDTSVVAPRAPAPAGSDTGADTSTGVPAIPSGAVPAASADTVALQIYPSAPRRGGVLFGFLPGTMMTSPRCSWKSAPVPCYALGDGILVTVPLSPDEPPGTYTLAIDRPTGRASRQVTVADRDFGGSDLIFLDQPKYALLGRGGEIARDARALRRVLSSQTSERYWSGRWKEPLPGARAGGYGEDRFYYPASDSARSIRVATGRRTRGAFAADTSAARPTDAPGWRHAGQDIPAKSGTSILAPARGVVADVGDYVLTGGTVLLDHGQGVHSAFFHLDSITVRKGDIVRSGERIGRVGATGLATGPHLHYGLYLHGEDVDPAAWRDMPPFALSDSAARTAFKAVR